MRCNLILLSLLFLSLWLKTTTQRPADVRAELVATMAHNDRLYRACLDNLKNQFTPGYRAQEIFGYLQEANGLRLRLHISQGSLKETGNPFDVAIDGQGFLLLEDGSLTRNGALRWNQGHLLVGGLKVMGHRAEGDNFCNTPEPILLPADRCNIQIEGDGLICSCQMNGDGLPIKDWRIAMANVAHPEWLNQKASRLLITSEVGEFWMDPPGRNGMGVLAQGTLELSNVNPLEQQKTAEALRSYAGLLSGLAPAPQL